MSLRDDLLKEVGAGNVSRRERGPLAIYNYTPACAFGRHWTATTRPARGLILEESTGRVVARPFEKFFNMNEIEETKEDVLPWGEPFEVTEKLDGSLGIVFFYDGRWDIATREAFESEQAVYARENLMPLYDWKKMGYQGRLHHAATYLVEIIYPENRVVVDYGEDRKLVFLASIETATGVQQVAEAALFRSYEAGMENAVVRRSDICLPQMLPTKRPGDLHDANAKCYVLHWPARRLRVKIKAPNYVAAHRCLDIVRPKRVLELMVEGKDDDIAAHLPGHVRPAFEEIRADLGRRVEYQLNFLAFKRADGATDAQLLLKAQGLVAKQLRQELGEGT